MSIHGIFIDGEWKTEPGAVKEAFKVHFADRFKQPINGRLKLNISFNNRLSTDQVVDLDRGVSRDEIRAAVWDCGDNKSPSPDGFTFEFFRRYWRFVGPDFCFAVECFFNNGTFPTGSNSSFIALIPKLEAGNYYHKSQVLGIGVPRILVTQAAYHRIGCVVMQRPFRYLGVMIGDCMSRKHAWDDTIQKLHARLSNWKVKTLSIGGRLTLLKSVLGASLLYNMSIYKVPKCVLNEMEAIRIKFFYGANSLERKITWVPWDKVLASKSNGGLGVSSFHALNRALLLKWVWRFISQDGLLRPVRDGAERQQLIDLNLPGSTLLSPSKDRWICDLSGDGEFRVKVARTKLDDVFLPSDLIATRWVKFIPIKVNVFAWRVRLDRLPTRVNLLRRELDMGVFPKSRCGLLPEDIHYVIFRCEIAQAIFRKIYR
ncbi:RNA-directed DNA polymerase, eukaryota [Tanacetum coccineum]